MKKIVFYTAKSLVSSVFTRKKKRKITLSSRAVVAVDLPTSRAQIFSRAQSASARFFMFSAAKASERAGARLVSHAKNHIYWRHFGANYLQKITSTDVILVRTICVPVACVVASLWSMSKQAEQWIADGTFLFELFGFWPIYHRFKRG